MLMFWWNCLPVYLGNNWPSSKEQSRRGCPFWITAEFHSQWLQVMFAVESIKILTRFSSLIWVWASSRSWWWTGKPGVLQFMGSQRTGPERLNWLTSLIGLVRSLLAQKRGRGSSSVPNICPWITCLPRKKTFTWRWHQKADWLVSYQGNVDLNQTNMLEQIIDSGIWEIMLARILLASRDAQN